MAKKKQNLSTILEKSKGMICDRFDALDDTAHLLVFETPKEVGIYHYMGDKPNVEELRTKASGNLIPKFTASMRKKTFYEQNWLTILVNYRLKQNILTINYYGI